MHPKGSRFHDLWSLDLLVALAVVLTACGGESPQGAADANEGGAPKETAVTVPTETAPSETTVGSVTFAVDGNEKGFEYLPESGSVYNPLASTIRAHLETGSTESLAIHFMSIDLKQLTYPAELPLPKDPSKPMSPMAAMASVGFDYIDAEGVEWAGPGKIQIESFDNNGTIRGSFDQVKLPHTDKEHHDITLTNGSFSARIAAPW